jgi:hypothetical protein
LLGAIILLAVRGKLFLRASPRQSENSSSQEQFKRQLRQLDELAAGCFEPSLRSRQ